MCCTCAADLPVRAFVVLTGRESSPLLVAGGCRRRCLHCSFYELCQDAFWRLFTSPALEKGELLLTSFLVLGAEVFMLLVHRSSRQTCVLPWSAIPRAVATSVRGVQRLQGAPSQSCTKVQRWIGSTAAPWLQRPRLIRLCQTSGNEQEVSWSFKTSICPPSSVSTRSSSGSLGHSSVS